jgi:hypothetical protein
VVVSRDYLKSVETLADRATSRTLQAWPAGVGLMNHIEFIEKHVRAELIKLGFTVSVAQGGIPGCGLVQAYEPGQQEGEILMMFSGLPVVGRETDQYSRTARSKARS